MAMIKEQIVEAPASITHADLKGQLAQMSHAFSVLSSQLREYDRVLQECQSRLAEEQKISSIYEGLYSSELAGHVRSSQALHGLVQDYSELDDESRAR